MIKQKYSGARDMKVGEILNKLAALERDRGITVLYACESGSRAWVIESTDSDFDVRFVYMHPLDWYLRLHPGRDTIEHPFGHMAGNLDFQGFDLRKALQLLGKSNPSVLEWLASPIIYHSVAAFTTPAMIAAHTFSASALMHHYISLAHRQYKAYWKPSEPVRLKKYLYAVRPLLCVMWMDEHGYSMPPVNFHKLLRGTLLSERQNCELSTLLAMKVETTEISGTGRFPALDGFIEYWLAQGRDLAERAPREHPDIEALNALFRDLVRAA